MIVSLDIVFMKIHACYVYSTVYKLAWVNYPFVKFPCLFFWQDFDDSDQHSIFVHRIVFDFCNCVYIICENNYFHGEAIPTYGTSGEVGCFPISMTNVSNVM